MQRALVGGILTGCMGGLLGSFTILRQLSFFLAMHWDIQHCWELALGFC